ncbi:hypothetical protein V8E36_000630 [Tilletia maclaganii]
MAAAVAKPAAAAAAAAGGSRNSAALLCAQLEAIFSPSLDPALVAAIAYEPNQTFEQASQVLSQLLPEEEDQAEAESSTTTATTTTATTTTATSSSFPSTPTLSNSSPPLSETQLHDLLDHWELNGHDHIPADDDPLLHLTDEESDEQRKLHSSLPETQPPAKESKSSTSTSKRKLNIVQPAQPSSEDTEPQNHQDDTAATLTFLIHAFPHLEPETLSTTLTAE